MGSKGRTMEAFWKYLQNSKLLIMYEQYLRGSRIWFK